MSADEAEVIAALVELHRGLERQGPGDDLFSDMILDRLPPLRSDGEIADLGCGTGAASVLLAQRFSRPVLCVDTSEDFLHELADRAAKAGVDSLTTTMCADMGGLDPHEHQFALIWSEGAAYNLTFDGALRAWRPLLPNGGLAVVSEMSWFGQVRPTEAAAFWAEAYPAMAGEEENIAAAERHGFTTLFTERLPTRAWWTNYYNPLLTRLTDHEGTRSPAIRAAITEIRHEIDLFRSYSGYYGYSFYVLEAA